MELDLTVNFDPENAEHKAKLGAFLREKGVLPNNVPLATEVKNALIGSNFDKMEEVASAFLSMKMAPKVEQKKGGIQIRTGKAPTSGYLICLYGQPGVGKSTLASYAEKPLFADVEGGIDRIDCASTPSKTWSDFENVLSYFSGQNEYKTLVIDTVDVLEKRLWAHICRTRKWASIESPGYGRGYAEALESWVTLLDKCREIAKTGKNFVFTAHSDVKTVLNPEGESYDRHNIKLHKFSSEHFFGQMDGIFFCYFDSHVRKNAGGDHIAVSSGERLIYCSDTLTAQVKNRFGLVGKITMNSDLFKLIGGSL